MVCCVVFLFPADVLEGYNGTIFAYGQTSSGKTHTMEVRIPVENTFRATKNCLLQQAV